MSGLRPVPEGASLEDLSADDFTRNNRATAWVEAQRESLGGKGAQNIRGDGVTRVKNNAGYSLAKYSVLGIDDPLFDPLVYFDSFNQEVALIGSVPYEATHSHKFVILQDPLVDLEVGRGWSDGIVPCKIDSASVTDVGTGTGTGLGTSAATCATIMDGRTDRLQGGFSGFPIVWLSPDDDYETGTGSGMSTDPFRWALIRMSSACGGGDISTTEDQECCAPCVCYPDADHIITECATGTPPGPGCLYNRYRIIASLPFSGETILLHDGGCLYVSDSFAPIICDVTYCLHHWELTVGSDPWTSILELVCDGVGTGTGTDCLCLSLLYKSMWYFNPICGNRFGRVFACDDVPTSIAHTFPCEICIVAVGDVCEPCPVGGVSLCDCPTPIPDVLTVTLSAPSCPNLDGVTFPITYIGASGNSDHRWYGEFSGIPEMVGIDCYQPFRFVFDIIGGIACEWEMGIINSEPTVTNPALLPDGRVVWGHPGGSGHGAVDCPFTSATWGTLGGEGTAVPTCVVSCFGTMSATVSV